MTTLAARRGTSRTEKGASPGKGIMNSISKPANRLYRILGACALALVLGILAMSLTVEPALAKDRNHERREQQWRHEREENQRQWRENQWRHRRHVAPPGYEYYAPPPPIYYAPPPMPPSFTFVIPLWIR